MRLLAITDIHGNVRTLSRAMNAAGGVDAILVLGDVAISRATIAKVYRALATSEVPVFVIHGNHEDEDAAREQAREHGLCFVHGAIESLGSLSIIGYGGDGFSTERDDLDAFTATLPEDLAQRSIVMTHAPPEGSVLDDLEGDHVGDRSVRRLIERVRPLLALSGHIHEHFHDGGTIGDTIIANPGDTGTLITITETQQGFAVSLKRL